MSDDCAGSDGTNSAYAGGLIFFVYWVQAGVGYFYINSGKCTYIFSFLIDCPINNLCCCEKNCPFL